ncbi:universal stress protein [bacterium]|nr:universal stress protein [bacterium]MCK4597745.1 universal stress protein [bacterium]
MFSKILLATDGSDNALRAAHQVARMVKKQPAKVMMLSAAYVPSMYLDDIGPELAESFVDEARQALQFTEEVFTKEKLTCETKLVRDLRPADAILQEAEKGNYDLIVMGSQGLSAKEAQRLGSISREVTEHAHCSVLVVK